MKGPYLLLQVVDSKGNVLEEGGEPLSCEYEFGTLGDTIAGFSSAQELLNEEFMVEVEEDEDDPED